MGNTARQRPQMLCAIDGFLTSSICIANYMLDRIVEYLSVSERIYLSVVSDFIYSERKGIVT
jgi:hypothetical protein